MKFPGRMSQTGRNIVFTTFPAASSHSADARPAHPDAAHISVAHTASLRLATAVARSQVAFGTADHGKPALLAKLRLPVGGPAGGDDDSVGGRPPGRYSPSHGEVPLPVLPCRYLPKRK